MLNTIYDLCECIYSSTYTQDKSKERVEELKIVSNVCKPTDLKTTTRDYDVVHIEYWMFESLLQQEI